MKTTEVNTKVYCDICNTLCEWKADYYNTYVGIEHIDWRTENVSAWREIVWILNCIFSVRRVVILWRSIFWNPKTIDICELCAVDFRKCYEQCKKRSNNDKL